MGSFLLQEGIEHRCIYTSYYMTYKSQFYRRVALGHQGIRAALPALLVIFLYGVVVALFSFSFQVLCK